MQVAESADPLAPSGGSALEHQLHGAALALAHRVDELQRQVDALAGSVRFVLFLIGVRALADLLSPKGPR